MDLDYCLCGKKTFNNNLYCSDECENIDSKSSNIIQQNPPVNLQFSITLSKNKYNDNTSKFKSYDCIDDYKKNYDNICYTSCTISGPIIIQRNSIDKNDQFEPNKGTFGK